MGSAWSGDPALVRDAERVFRSRAGTAAVAVVTPEHEMTATAGCDQRSTFEIGSISKALTGMLYRDVAERGVLSPTTVLGDVLPLRSRQEIGSVSLSSLAIHRSGLPNLPPAMQPLRRSLELWTRGENPYGDSLADLLEQTRDLLIGPVRPRYSNLGFQLLGHAIAAAADTSYEHLLQGVLGGGFRTPTQPDDLGPADIRGVSRFGRPRAAWVGEAIAPAGGIRASISTMREVLRSVLDGTAPGIAALEPVADFSPRVRIGAGWITLEHKARHITWHNGSTGGFSSWIGLDRNAGVGVVVLAARHGSVDRQGFQLLTGLAPPA
jgi:CubicO group peptidase (beta-lactamase class C family)